MLTTLLIAFVKGKVEGGSVMKSVPSGADLGAGDPGPGSGPGPGGSGSGRRPDRSGGDPTAAAAGERPAARQATGRTSG